MDESTAQGHVLAGRYRLDRIVGRGGMATVYRAVDEALERVVAIKIFRPELADTDYIRRRRDEIRLIASLSHPSLVTLFDAVADDAGEDGAQAFLVLQYVDGQDLKHGLETGGLAPGKAAGIGADIASALAYLADRKVVHRDLKPANILLASPGGHGSRALLADFGIARIVDATRLTATGSVMGTASYLSPEQAMGRSVDSSSDVYSLGLVLIECLTGVRSFEGSVAESVAARLTSDPAVPEEFGPSWFELLAAMTARNPEDRIGAGDAAAILAGLAEAAADSTGTTALLPETGMSTARLTAAPELPRERFAPESNAPTERFGVPVPAAIRPVQVDKTRPARGAPEVRRRRWLPVAAIAVGAVVVAIAGGTMLGQIPQAAEGPPQVEYPVIDGQLGTHLEQLQNSVTP